MIPSIGKQKITYKDHSNIKFENIDFYLDLAKKIIAKMAPSFFNGLSKEMLKNEDAISFVASAIMMGDWRWKNNKENDASKTYKTLYSYRNQCGIWAIKTYVTKKYKQNNNKKKIKITHSINYSDDELVLEGLIPDNSQKDPVEILINREKHNNISQDIKNLLDMSNISEKQKDYIKLYYYENMTLEQIGKEYGVTREAVRQSIKSAIGKIKEICL